MLQPWIWATSRAPMVVGSSSEDFPVANRSWLTGWSKVEVLELAVVDREADLDLVVLRQAGRDGGQEAGRGVDPDVVYCWLLEVGRCSVLGRVGRGQNGRELRSCVPGSSSYRLSLSGSP